MCPPMCTRIAAFGLVFEATCSNDSNDMQRSARLQSANATDAPARIAASAVAMKVFDGSTPVEPSTSAKCRAAIAPPVQDEVATAGMPFQASHASSNAVVIVAS